MASKAAIIAWVKVLDGAIKLLKMQPIKAKLHREIMGTVKSITLSLSTTGKYHASILVDDGLEVPQPIHSVEKAANARSDFQHN